MTNEFIAGAAMGAIITALAYWALLWVCNRAPAGSKREAVARVLSGGGPRPKVGA